MTAKKKRIEDETIITKEVERRVRLKLNREEEEKALVDMLAEMKSRDSVQDAKAAAMKDFRRELNEKEAKIGELRERLELGDWIDALCVQTMDLNEKTVEVKIKATGDVIESRPMTEEELQGNLF